MKINQPKHTYMANAGNDTIYRKTREPGKNSRDKDNKLTGATGAAGSGN